MSCKILEEMPSEKVRDVMQEMMKINVLPSREKSDALLREFVTFDPMSCDRDWMSKVGRNYNFRRCMSRNELISEAKRMVTEEEIEEKRSKRKTKLLEIELHQFKMDLAKSSQKLEKDLLVRAEVSHTKLSVMKRKKFSKMSSFEIHSSSPSTEESSIEEPTLEKNTRDLAQQIPDKIQRALENGPKENAMKNIQLDPIHPESNMHIQKTKKIHHDIPMQQLKAIIDIHSIKPKKLDSPKIYFLAWQKHVKNKQKLNSKMEDEENKKIDQFIQKLSQVKHPTEPKIPKSTVYIKPCKPIKFAKFSAASKGRDFSAQNKNLTKLERIVQQQKAKLQEQEKLISELKLEKIKLANERSAQQAQIYLESSYKEMSHSTRRRLQHIKNTFPEILDKNFKIGSRPSFLVQMETRERERRKRKEELHTETLRRIAEHQRLEAQREEERKAQRAEQEQMEREQRLRQLKEEIEMRKLDQKAVAFNRHRRLKLGFEAFKRALQRKRALEVTARSYWRTQALQKAFKEFQRVTQELQSRRVERLREKLDFLSLKCSWRTWRMACLESKRNRQVAGDFYNLHLVARTFDAWRTVTISSMEDLALLMEEACEHRRRFVLRRCFGTWRRLRETREEERVVERKKEALRNSVRLVLPDFKPALPMSALPPSSALQLYQLISHNSN